MFLLKKKRKIQKTNFRLGCLQWFFFVGFFWFGFVGLGLLCQPWLLMETMVTSLPLLILAAIASRGVLSTNFWGGIVLCMEIATPPCAP